jgi:hypothetical protein
LRLNQFSSSNPSGGVITTLRAAISTVGTIAFTNGISTCFPPRIKESKFCPLVVNTSSIVPRIVPLVNSIVEPINNDTIAFNEEVHFEGTVSGSAEMHGYTVTFTNGTTSSVLYTKSYDIHANSYNFHEHWINNVTDTTIVKLKIDVTKDHDGNHEVKEVNVVCLPQ